MFPVESVMEIDEAKIDKTIQSQFCGKDPCVHNTIEPIHPQVDFYYNSLNIAIGKQGCGKTTFLCKELMKLSEVPNQPYCAILYVSSGDVDYTFVTLKQYIKIPVYSSTYADFLSQFKEFCAQREQNNTHVFIIFEDASFIFQKDNPEWNNIICRLRHLRCTLWLNIHVWKSVSTTFKSQLTTAFIFKGYPREQMQWIYRQMSVSSRFDFFFNFYLRLQQRQCLKVDNTTSEFVIVN